MELWIEVNSLNIHATRVTQVTELPYEEMLRDDSRRLSPYIYTVKHIGFFYMALCQENGHSNMEANKLLLFFRRKRHIGTASVWTNRF